MSNIAKYLSKPNAAVKDKVQSERGQSLVEMAIATPLLIFLLLGVFEVGSAIRTYVVMVNVNREITRFAVRPGYLDFSTEETVDASYRRVLDWVDTSLAGQLDMEFDEVSGDATLIVSHVVVDTDLPRDPETDPNPEDWDCNKFDPDHPDYDPDYAFSIDDTIIHPDKDHMEFQAQRFGPAATVTGARDTRIDYAAVVADLTVKNNQFNCEILKKSGIPSASNLIITELYLDQPQLFGFPLISNPFTDPVPLYSHTTMRLTCAARSGGTEEGNLACGVDAYGPICAAYPLIVYTDTIKYGTPDEDNEKLNKKVDIFNGHSDFGPGDEFGWLAWNPDSSTGSEAAPYLRNELRSSTMAMNDFTDAREPSDHTLSVGDYVASIGGDRATVESSHGLLTNLKGKKIRIPVWDTFEAGTGPDERDAYHIVGFAWVRIESASDFDGLSSAKTIYATYLGDAADDCPTSDAVATNTPPVAVDDNVSTPENTPKVIDVLGNDSDPDGDTLIIDAVVETSSPFKGTIQITDGGTTVTYTPKNNDTGTYEFTYTISDGNGGTDTATVTVTVTAVGG
jgi:hypothetical protein